MYRPELGICIPCTYHALRDADTPVVRLRTGQLCAVRLIDCWAAERGTTQGDRATEFLRSVLEGSDGDLAVFFPLAKDRNKDGTIDIMDLLSATSFDRIPAHLFIGSTDISDMLVARGYATKERTP